MGGAAIDTRALSLHYVVKFVVVVVVVVVVVHTRIEDSPHVAVR